VEQKQKYWLKKKDAYIITIYIMAVYLQEIEFSDKIIVHIITLIKL